MTKIERRLKTMNKSLVSKQFYSAMALVLGFSLLTACSDSGDSSISINSPANEEVDPNVVNIAAGDGFQTRLLEALIGAQPGLP